MKKIFISIFCFIAISGCVPGMKMFKNFENHTLSRDPLCNHMFVYKWSDANQWSKISYFAWAKQGGMTSCGWATSNTVANDATDEEIMAVAIGNCERYKLEKYGPNDAKSFINKCKILFKGYELYDEKDITDNIDFQ